VRQRTDLDREATNALYVSFQLDCSMFTSKKIITKTERLVYSNKYARMFDNDVIFPNGVEGHYLKFEWTAPYSVGVLPVLEDNRIYLIRNFRYARNEMSIEIPKGFGDESMLPVETAAKELREETGLSAAELHHVASLAPDPALIKNSIHLFEARGCIEKFTRNPEDTEVLASPLIVDRSEIIGLIRNHSITDAITVSALLLYFAM
jgi:8-oxo-dGTP pyrophosphatase MutT (NUDIX family)